MKKGIFYKKAVRFAGGVCFGLLVGAALGAVTEKMGMLLPAGLVIGLCFGALISHNVTADNAEDAGSDGEPNDENEPEK